jgi:hypothetical protein
MPYMLLIMEPRAQRAERGVEAGRKAYEQMQQWGAGLHERGLLVASESLASDTKGVRVQRRDGRQSLVDGPFTEAKEMIGGFFLIDCATLDEAVGIAGSCPAVEWCTVEVREVAPCWT